MAQDDTKGQSMSEEERRKKNKGGDKATHQSDKGHEDRNKDNDQGSQNGGGM